MGGARCFRLSLNTAAAFPCRCAAYRCLIRNAPHGIDLRPARPTIYFGPAIANPGRDMSMASLSTYCGSPARQSREHRLASRWSRCGTCEEGDKVNIYANDKNLINYPIIAGTPWTVYANKKNTPFILRALAHSVASSSKLTASLTAFEFHCYSVYRSTNTSDQLPIPSSAGMAIATREVAPRIPEHSPPTRDAVRIRTTVNQGGTSC